MSDHPTQPFYAPRGPQPAYERYPAYPPEPPRRSGGLAALAVALIVALVVVGVLAALLLDARHNLDATKATLAQTRTAVDQSATGAAGLQQQLTAAKQAAADSKAAVTRLQAEVTRLKAVSATTASAVKQRDQEAKDLRDCAAGYLQMFHLQTVELQNLQADSLYTPSSEPIKRTLDEIRGACGRVQLTDGTTP